MKKLIIEGIFHHQIHNPDRIPDNRWRQWRREHGLELEDMHSHGRTVNLLQIRTQEGLSGWQIGGNVETAAIANQLLVGADAMQHRAIWERCRAESSLSNKQHGDIDCAIWDLIGRALEQPVHRLLGGARERIPCYASTQFDVGTPDDYADQAEAAYKAGYRAYKIHPYTCINPSTWQPVDGYDIKRGRRNMKMCHGFPEADMEICEAVRNRVGPQMELMLDPHGRYEGQSFETICRVADKLHELNFTWFEVPFDEARITDYARLRAYAQLPIVGPEWSQGGVATRAQWIEAGASDISRSDVHHQGITGARQCQELASAHGLRCEIHRGGWDNMQVVAAVPESVTRFYERFIIDPFNTSESGCAFLFGEELPDALQDDGTVTPPMGPGLGFDTSKIEECITCAA